MVTGTHRRISIVSLKYPVQCACTAMVTVMHKETVPCTFSTVQIPQLSYASTRVLMHMPNDVANHVLSHSNHSVVSVLSGGYVSLVPVVSGTLIVPHTASTVDCTATATV